MAVKPLITWIGSPNFGFPDGTHGQNEPEAIVYHIAQGSMAGIDAWFNNPNSYASTHFAVGLGGEIHQYVRVQDAAWGNGVMNAPDTSIPWLKFCWENEINPNLKTVSIEHEGFTGNPWPEAMYEASRALTVWLVDAHHLRHLLVGLDNRFVGHYRIDSVQRANCPGTGWPRARLFQDLGRLEDVYVPRTSVIYENKTFELPSSGVAHLVPVDAVRYGCPPEATAVDLLVGCRSRSDGAYVAAYDGTTAGIDKVAVYPTAPLRYDWNFGRGRVELEGRRFLLRIRPIQEPVQVTVVIKGYYALE